MIKIPKQPILHNDGSIINSNISFINCDYEVTVNGNPCDVRECRVSAMPFNRFFPGYQRSIDQTELASFITFSADEEVIIKVKCKNSFDEAVIRPLSKGVLVEKCGQELKFTLKEHGGYSLELDDEHNALHIFFNKIKEYLDKDQADYYFGPGIHFPGIITLKDNQSVYVDEEAVVYGSIYSPGAENIRVFGGGVIDGSTEERVYGLYYENYTKGNIRLYNCKNVKIEDVILKNSAIWVLSLFECNNVTIDNIKIVGQWRYNTDGIDIVNTSNVFIKNSFIRSFDDTITLKGIYDKVKIIENITVENCVMWCGWGRNIEIGAETAVDEIRNIVFKDCDLIHSSTAAIDIYNCHYAAVHDVKFENINVEYQKNTMPAVIQENDLQKYDDGGKICIPYLINVENPKVYEEAAGIGNDKNSKYGEAYNLVYKNINAYTDEICERPLIRFESEKTDVIFRNITLENFFVNGKKVNPLEYFEIKIVNTEDITIK